MSADRVLFIAHRIPYPPNKGDKIRSYHVLRYLADRYRVSLACMIDDAEDVASLEPLRAMVDELFHVVRTPLAMKLKAAGSIVTGEPFTKPCFYSRRLQQQIDGWLDNNEVRAIYCFCSSAAAYVFRSRHFQGLQRNKILLADLVDVDSEKWRQYAEQKTGVMRWLFLREARYLRPYEQQIVDGFDRTFLVSEEEKRVLGNGGDVDKVEALANGVDLDYFTPGAQPGVRQGDAANRLVFSGAMDYWPNIEGAVWFAKHVFPSIRAAIPDAVFCIAGRNPDDAVLALRKTPGIEVTGTVPDIRDYLTGAALCVAPLQIARGIQNKVLEGMAMQKTVLATPGAATGLKAAPGEEIVVAGEASAMAEAAIALLQNAARRQHIGRNARRYVERAHSWGAQLDRLNALMDMDKGTIGL